MYGALQPAHPRRIVCLSSEATEIAFALGAGPRVVGVPGTARRPADARSRPRIGGFTTFRTDRILALEPDLVLAFSDLQADVARDLIRAGVTVLTTNQRSLAGIFQAVHLIGGALGLAEPARALVTEMEEEIRQTREFTSGWVDPPRVYFEEWPDPLITGVRWVSELVEAAGGRDVFSELRDRRTARERVVAPEEVVRRNPQIVVASWCGKPVDLAAIRARPGWSEMDAARANRLYEIPGEDVLSPGPSVLHGLRALHEIIQAAVAR